MMCGRTLHAISNRFKHKTQPWSVTQNQLNLELIPSPISLSLTSVKGKLYLIRFIALMP